MKTTLPQGRAARVSCFWQENKKSPNVFQLAGALPQQKCFLPRQNSDSAERRALPLAKRCLISAQPGCVRTARVIAAAQPRWGGCRDSASSRCARFTVGEPATATRRKELKHPTAENGLESWACERDPVWPCWCQSCLSAWVSKEEPQNKVSPWAGVRQGLWDMP